MVSLKALFVLVVISCISRSALSFESDDEQDYLEEKRLFRRDSRWSRYFGTSFEEGSNEWDPYVRSLPRMRRGSPRTGRGLANKYSPFKLRT